MERSDRIRTYNFPQVSLICRLGAAKLCPLTLVSHPQDRVTDHRIGLSLSALDRVMEGDAEPGLINIIDALKEHEEELRLTALHAELEAHEEAAAGSGKGGKGKK